MGRPPVRESPLIQRSAEEKNFQKENQGEAQLLTLTCALIAH